MQFGAPTDDAGTTKRSSATALSSLWLVTSFRIETETNRRYCAPTALAHTVRCTRSSPVREYASTEPSLARHCWIWVAFASALARVAEAEVDSPIVKTTALGFMYHSTGASRLFSTASRIFSKIWWQTIVHVDSISPIVPSLGTDDRDDSAAGPSSHGLASEWIAGLELSALGLAAQDTL